MITRWYRALPPDGAATIIRHPPRCHFALDYFLFSLARLVGNWLMPSSIAEQTIVTLAHAIKLYGGASIIEDHSGCRGDVRPPSRIIFLSPCLVFIHLNARRMGIINCEALCAPKTGCVPSNDKWYGFFRTARLQLCS